MARGVNRATILGNVGKDPETRFMSNGKAVTNISVATSESWKDKQTGEQRESTEWHNVVFFDRLAEVVGEYVKKGSQIYVEGKITTRKWQDKDGKDRYTTEIVANELQLLGGAQGGSGQQDRSAPRREERQRPPAGAKTPTQAAAEFDDDIPF